MSTELVINREELSMDSRNRRVQTLTEVLRLSLPLGMGIQRVLNNLYEKVDNDFMCYDYDKDYYEVYGNVVLMLLDILKGEMPDTDFNKEWLEDGVNSEGIMFNIDDQLYQIEIEY